MRTTMNIRDALLSRLKLAAQRSGVSLTDIVNQTLEVGLDKLSPLTAAPPYQFPTFSLGEPNFNLDKALRFAVELEDEETLRKLQLRK